jgi:hypothetical protein
VLLASRLLDAPASKKLLDKANRNSAVLALVKEARSRMLRAARDGELHEFLGGIKAYDRLRYRLLPVATLLTTRTVGDHEAMPLPKPLWDIYYVTRPLRLAGKLVIAMLERR